MTRGRPRVPVSPERVREMKAAGMSYRKIAQELRISVWTAHNLNRMAASQPANYLTRSPAILEASTPRV